MKVMHCDRQSGYEKLREQEGAFEAKEKRTGMRGRG